MNCWSKLQTHDNISFFFSNIAHSFDNVYQIIPDSASYKSSKKLSGSYLQEGREAEAERKKQS